MKRKNEYAAPTASVTELKTVDVVTISQNHISMAFVAEDILLDGFNLWGSTYKR